MRTEEDLLKDMREMAREAGEAFGHLMAAEKAIKVALARISEEDLAALDPESDIGKVVDQVTLALRRAVLPVAAGLGALATACKDPEEPR
jgi:hypothetical protein